MMTSSSVEEVPQDRQYIGHVPQPPAPHSRQPIYEYMYSYVYMHTYMYTYMYICMNDI